jgi:hypothetical protein
MTCSLDSLDLIVESIVGRSDAESVHGGAGHLHSEGTREVKVFDYRAKPGLGRDIAESVPPPATECHGRFDIESGCVAMI